MFIAIKNNFHHIRKTYREKLAIKAKNKKFNFKILSNSKPLSNHINQKYVIPFYLNNPADIKFKDEYFKIHEDINTNIITTLLGDQGWRSRQVGAYFAAVKNKHEFQDNIGKLLLRSDTCFSGHYYCLALASFSSKNSIYYLKEYLDYYLLKPELYFNQNSAMAAIVYLSKVLNNDYYSEYLKMWNQFIQNKPNWNLDTSIENFNEEMTILNSYKSSIALNGQ